MQWKNDKAIFLQVIEYFKHQVILKEYLPGDKITSVREYALHLGINPNTVVKAYDELVIEGLIEAKSTNGFYLTSDESMIDRIKTESAKKYQMEYLLQMKKIGYEKEEAIKMLEETECY